MERLEDFQDGNKRYQIDLTAKIIVDAEHDNCCAIGCPWLDNYHTLDCTLFRSPLEKVNLPHKPRFEGDLEYVTCYKRCQSCLDSLSGVVEL